MSVFRLCRQSEHTGISDSSPDAEGDVLATDISPVESTGELVVERNVVKIEKTKKAKKAGKGNRPRGNLGSRPLPTRGAERGLPGSGIRENQRRTIHPAHPGNGLPELHPALPTCSTSCLDSSTT